MSRDNNLFKELTCVGVIVSLFLAVVAIEYFRGSAGMADALPWLSLLGVFLVLVSVWRLRQCSRSEDRRRPNNKT